MSTVWLILLILPRAYAQQTLELQCDNSATTANFTLNATFHTVHGTFKLESCSLRYDPASAKISGEISFDAASGETGNDGRDRKMHKEVLESARFKAITFRPDRVEGKVPVSGTSTVQVRGTFSVHGSEHEITVPADVKLENGGWSATSHFTVPYVKWGLKNPSNVFLHVGDSVEVEFKGGGSLARAPQ